MNNFKTYNEVLELFRNNNCIGNENCIFITYKDGTQDGMKAGTAGLLGGAVGGAIGAFAAGMATEYDEILAGLGTYAGLIINQTENGFGIIPLCSKGISLSLNIDKLELKPEKFMFINNENIESISIKNFNIFTKNTKKLAIKLKNGTDIRLMARVSEKLIPYQQENFAKFMSRYGK